MNSLVVSAGLRNCAALKLHARSDRSALHDVNRKDEESLGRLVRTPALTTLHDALEKASLRGLRAWSLSVLP